MDSSCGRLDGRVSGKLTLTRRCVKHYTKSFWQAFQLLHGPELVRTTGSIREQMFKALSYGGEPPNDWLMHPEVRGDMTEDEMMRLKASFRKREGWNQPDEGESARDQAEKKAEALFTTMIVKCMVNTMIENRHPFDNMLKSPDFEENTRVR